MVTFALLIFFSRGGEGCNSKSKCVCFFCVFWGGLPEGLKMFDRKAVCFF